MKVTQPSKQILPDGTVRWQLEGGAHVLLRRLAPGMMYFAAAGNISQFVAEAAQTLELEIAREGKITVFANLYETTRMAPDVRDAWSEWSKKHQNNTLPYCLVRSKIMEMAMSLISMFSGANMRTFSDPADFLGIMKRAAPNSKLPQITRAA